MRLAVTIGFILCLAALIAFGPPALDAYCWEAYFHTLPDTLTFCVKEKMRSHDSWTDAIITNTIQFKRAF